MYDNNWKMARNIVMVKLKTKTIVDFLKLCLSPLLMSLNEFRLIS